MKICIRCGGNRVDHVFRCSGCGWVPQLESGIPVLAPELHASFDDYPVEHFDDLKRLEDGHFWFENRNRLLTWALGRYFPGAERFFELGCGTGFVLKGLSQTYPGVALTGGDAVVPALLHARGRVPQAEFVQIDGRALPFRSEMDVIGAFDVVEHIEEDEAVLVQIREALRPAGGVILTVPQHRILWSAVDEHARHKRRYSRAELVDKVESAGFELLYVTSFVTLLMPVMLLVRWLKRHQTEEELDPAAEFRIAPRLNTALRRVLGVEGALIERGVPMPAGGSLLLIARKSESR